MNEPFKTGTILHSTLADSESIDELFRLILGRSINNDEFKASVHNVATLHHWVKQLVRSDEFKVRFFERVGVQPPSSDFIPDSEYRTPRLFPSKRPERILVTGSCMVEIWSETLRREYPDMQVRHIVFNNASEMEDIETEELQRFAFQIAQIPTRSIIHEPDYFLGSAEDFRLSAFDALLERCKQRVKRNFDAAMKYNRQCGLPVFVFNFPTPQANPLGFLLPKFDKSNLVQIFEELNRFLASLVAANNGVYVIDFDAICATLGKRYINDDLTSHINHGSFIGSTYWPEDIDLTPYGSADAIYQPKIRQAVLAVFNECLASHYVISSNTKIKIVIFDLDGALWRGVPAEADELAWERISEGWPLSILEAAAFLKKRGVLLAIASKNDASVAKDIWERTYGKRFPLSNFASVHISWDSKVQSIGEILSEVNLLPENCLVVDDNPVEREQVRMAFPGISVITGPISTWRRTLLWAAELQTPVITAESTRRTESIQGVIARETLRAETDPKEFALSLGITATIYSIMNVGDKKFARVFELLNKTNQFNTTGVRWTEPQLEAFFDQGGVIDAADVADKLNNYGLTALLLRRGGECVQMVMSCRVFGLYVEYMFLQRFLELAADHDRRYIDFKRTEKNGPSATFLSSLGLISQAACPRREADDRYEIGKEFEIPGELLRPVTVIAKRDPASL
jgi:FkbH-like protein